MEFQPPARVGPYRIDRVLGHGGMGSVWAAFDERSGRSVALKFLRASGSRPDHSARLVREATVSSLVRHPALVEVVEVIELAGAPVLVMERLLGETLRARLLRAPRLSLADAAALLLPVAEALVMAHGVGIVHRDLKPENLFLSSRDSSRETETLRVLDFGIAKFMVEGGGGELAPLTALGALLGTPPYMAPEQALASGDIDERADVWAFGVILYELVCGFRPLEAEGAGDAIRRLLFSGIAPLASVEPDLPPEFCALVDRMLTRRLDLRERNLVEVERALRAQAGDR